MATIQPRKSKSGTITTYRVLWRTGGRRDGAWDGETCDEWRIARKFKALVEAAGERRPEGYPKGCRGRTLAPAEPVEELEERAPTFAEVAEEYLETLEDVEPRTLAEYRRDLLTHVYPAVVKPAGGQMVGPLGGLPIDVAEDVDLWQAWVKYMRTKTYGKKVKKKYSAKTIINIHVSVISPVFEYAVFRKYCGMNPARWVKLPERKGRSVKAHHVLDVDEFSDWIDCAYEVDNDAGDITALILGTGLRWGELTALRRCDVKIQRDEETGEIVGGVMTIAQVVKEDENRRPYIATVQGKSGNAFRVIAIGADAATILAIRMEGRADDAILFPPPGTRGGTLWRNPNFHTNRWKKVEKIAAERGLTKDPSPHRMRHAHATALIPLHGIESVSKRIGHANVAVTSAVYSHLVPATDARMATSLDGRLRRKQERTASGTQREKAPAA